MFCLHACIPLLEASALLPQDWLQFHACRNHKTTTSKASRRPESDKKIHISNISAQFYPAINYKMAGCTCKVTAALAKYCCFHILNICQFLLIQKCRHMTSNQKVSRLRSFSSTLRHTATGLFWALVGKSCECCWYYSCKTIAKNVYVAVSIHVSACPQSARPQCSHSDRQIHHTWKEAFVLCVTFLMSESKEQCTCTK